MTNDSQKLVVAAFAADDVTKHLSWQAQYNAKTSWCSRRTAKHVCRTLQSPFTRLTARIRRCIASTKIFTMSAKAHAFQAACRTCLFSPKTSQTSPVLLKTFSAPRGYASLGKLGGSESSGSAPPARRAITVTSDDGRYSWSELSTGKR